MKENSLNGKKTFGKVNDWIVLLGLMTFLNILFYWKFITGQEYFLVSSDMGVQQYSALVQFLDHFKDGMKGWSFLTGLGNSYDFSSYVFSPNILLLIFGKENLKYTFIWYHLVKMYLAAIVFYLALNKLGIKKKAAVCGALLYVYSATFIVRSFWEVYAMEFVLFAVLLYALECYFQDKNWLILVIAIFLLGSQLQLYYIVVYAFAMLCYALLRNYLVTSYRGKEFWKYIVRCALIMCGSLLLLGYRLVPQVIATFSSSRVAAVGSQLKSGTSWSSLLRIAGGDRLIAVFNSFFAISLEGSIGNTTFCPNALDGPLFYVGLLALLLFPQCVKQLDRKWKRVWGILAAVIVIYCMIPAVTYICNLGADEDYFKLSTMWMLALLIISAVFVLDGLLRRGWNINRKLLFITYGTLMLCFIGVNLGNADYRSRLNMIMFAKVLIYLTAWFVFFLCYQRIRNRKVLYSLFALILCSEIYFFIHPTMSTAEHLADGLKYVVDGEENQQMIDSIKADENDDFYRIYFRDMRMSDYNTEGILCDFDSMGYGGQNVKSGYVDFLNAIKSEPVNRPTWKRSNGFLSHYMIDSLASLKYAVLDKNEVPPHGFEKVSESDNYTIYKNKYSMPLGVVMEHAISYEDFKQLSLRQKDLALLNSVITEKISSTGLDTFQNVLEVEEKNIGLQDLAVEGMSMEKGQDETYSLNCMSEDVNSICISTAQLGWTEDKEYIVTYDFYAPQESMIGVQWNVNGEWKQKTICVAEGWNTVNFTIECSQTDTIAMYFQKGNYKLKNFCYEAGSMEQIDTLYEDAVSNRTYMEITDFKDGRIEGTVDTKKYGILFFMIPYDEKWQVYIDDQAVETQLLDYGFMGVPVEKGKHEIRLEYVP